MDKLLSNKWDNSFLNEAMHESMIHCRRDRFTNSPSAAAEIEFFRTNSFYLVDHPAMQKLNSDVIVVESNNRSLIFMNKSGLVNELEKHSLPDANDVVMKVTEYTLECGRNVMNNKDILNISSQDFTTLLKEANLDNMVKILELESNVVKSKVTI